MDTQAFQRFPDIRGDDVEDTALLRAMAEEASDYVTSQKWCPVLTNQYLAFGFGGVVAVFLFEFAKKIQGTDDKLWVVVGDLPSAYLVVEAEDNPIDALARYCGMMEEWSNAVLTSRDLSSVFPVSAEPTLENANLLLQRLTFLRDEIVREQS